MEMACSGRTGKTIERKCWTNWKKSIQAALVGVSYKPVYQTGQNPPEQKMWSPRGILADQMPDGKATL